MSFQRLFDVCATSNRRWNDVVCLQGRGFILCHRHSLGKPLRFASKSRRYLKFNPLKVHQLSPYSCPASSSRFPWKGYNFYRLKDIFGEYSIKRMKELLSWLLYPIGCESTTKIAYIVQIYTTWIATNIKYHIRLLWTLFALQT